MVNRVVKYSLLAFPAASCGLGYWQIKRLGWKKGLISDLEMQMENSPVDLLSLDLSNGTDQHEYRRVRVRGRYDVDPKHQLYLKPRQIVINEEATARGRTANQSGVGANVITPFQFDGTNFRILVNRGWLSLKGKDNVKDNAQVGLTDATQELTGVLRKSDNRSTYGVHNDETLQDWHIRDISAMARRLNTKPIMIDLDADPKRTEGPYGGQTQLNIRNEHLNYAITWFSLAAFSFMMWYTKFGRRKRPTR
jgi:surfeit locus 1 family protein